MTRIHFVTCADRNYALTAAVMIGNLLRLYPGCPIWVYDWGLDQADRETFDKHAGVTLIDWTKRAGRRFRIQQTLHRHYWPLSIYLRQRHLMPEALVRVLGIELLFLEKVRCVMHASTLAGNVPLVYLDGDAVPIRNIDALVDAGFDLTFTIRRTADWCWDVNECRILNAGVMGFGADAVKRGQFMEHWLHATRTIGEAMSDQTALTRMLETRNREILRPGGAGTIDLNGCVFNVQVLDGEQFNFTRIEELVEAGGEIPETIRVLHFKHRQFRRERFRRILKQADLSSASIAGGE